MTVITKIELIETWLLIWTGSHNHRSRMLGSLLLLLRFGSIFIYTAVTVFVVGIDLPAADQFAISAGLAFGCQFLVLFIIFLITGTRTGARTNDVKYFLRWLSLSTTFALPTLVALHYGIYALPFVVLPMAVLTSERFFKSRLSREFMLVALIGCAMPVVVAS